MENFRENRLNYIILILFLINLLSFLFHSYIGIGVAQALLIDLSIIVLTTTLLIIKRFKLSLFWYITFFLILILVIAHIFVLLDFLSHLPL